MGSRPLVWRGASPAKPELRVNTLPCLQIL
jgi:hypothetical protein